MSKKTVMVTVAVAILALASGYSYALYQQEPAIPWERTITTTQTIVFPPVTVNQTVIMPSVIEPYPTPVYRTETVTATVTETVETPAYADNNLTRIRLLFLEELNDKRESMNISVLMENRMCEEYAVKGELPDFSTQQTWTLVDLTLDRERDQTWRGDAYTAHRIYNYAVVKPAALSGRTFTCGIHMDAGIHEIHIVIIFLGS